MDRPIRQYSHTAFGNAYQMVRMFERNRLDGVSQIQLDVLIELYRSHPSPLMMKVLCLSTHCAESTLRSVMKQLIDRHFVVETEMQDSRARCFKLTRDALFLLRAYEDLVLSTYGMFQRIE
jgi:DNA-binding MarR family transcriptional regulator